MVETTVLLVGRLVCRHMDLVVPEALVVLGALVVRVALEVPVVRTVLGVRTGLVVKAMICFLDPFLCREVAVVQAVLRHLHRLQVEAVAVELQQVQESRVLMLPWPV